MPTPQTSTTQDKPTATPRHAQDGQPLATTASASPAEPRKAFVRAHQLELAGRESMVFGPIDFAPTEDHLAVVTGQQGAGRSALLLALAGRLKGVQGELHVGEIDGITHPRKLRKEVSVARITGLADLEPNLTIAESRDERAIAEGIGLRRGRERFTELESLLGHQFNKEQWIDRVPAVERTLLTIALGCLSPARYVVLDDVDESLTDRQLRWIYDGLEILHEQGNNFVLTALEQSPLPTDATVLHLSPPPSRTEPNFELHLRRRKRSATPSSAATPTSPEND